MATVLGIAVNAAVLSPELIVERGWKKENVAQWDRIMSILLMISWFVLYVVAGLDDRFEWTSAQALWVHVTGVAGFVLGNALVTWAMVSNMFFSRMQSDRGQTVSSGGSYQSMRHPGYLGMMVYTLSTPLILGSLWAFIPALVTVFLFIIRTAFEDRTLKKRLEGYVEYAEKVKYRFLPMVW